MASFNKLVIVGYLGRDPEIKYLPDGTPVCTFSIATTEKTKRGGEAQDITTWFRVNVWGKQGEACNQYLSKGSQAYVEGRLSQAEFTDRDGNKRTNLEVRATDVQFLLGGSQQGETTQAPRAQAAKASHEQRGFGGRDEDDSVPF